MGRGKKFDLRPWLYSKITIGVLFLLCLAMLSPVWGMYERYRGSLTRVEDRREHWEYLEDRHALLQGRINRLESDRGLEAELRRRFNAAKEGEKMVVLVEEEAPLEEEVDERQDPSLWDRIKSLWERN